MSCDYQQLPHLGIQTLKPYIPGKPIEELAKEQGIPNIIKMASNENPYGCSEKVTEALANLSFTDIANYPSPINHPLREQLGDKLGIPKHMITLGNGSDLLFSLFITVFALHSGKQIVVHDKAFISYEIQAQTLGVPVQKIPLKRDWQVDIDAMIEASQRNTAILFLANPNNPTGIFTAYNDIERLLSQVPESTIVVVDEAYHEYASSYQETNGIALLAKFPNLIITRTFSKVYGLAGLRLGYAIACPDITELLWKVQLPFAINQAALQAASAALTDEDFIRNTLECTQEGMQELQRGLEALELPYLPSYGNFICFDCRMDASMLYQALLKEGIILRPLQAYGLPHHLRLTIGTKEQNRRFINTLGRCLSNLKGE